jgi:monovalent cation:proton antiporter-2 (CPA2) family protein
MTDIIWIRELMLVLATVGVVVPLFGRLRFGVVPGFLIAGLILGPGGLGRLAVDLPWLQLVTFSDHARVEPIAELGVLFLLFLIGLEFSFERLWSMRRAVFGVGSLQVFVSCALIAAAMAWLGVPPTIALVIGLAFALSSTAIVTQYLIGAHRFATPVGRASLGVLLFQDLTVVPFVIVVGLLGGGAVGLSDAIVSAIVLGGGAVAAIIVAARYFMRPLMRMAAAADSREFLVAIALLVVIGAALLTSAAGLSPALGAFLAGILLAGSEYRHQLEIDIEPFKGLLLGLFFMTVGMTLDVVVLLEQPLFLIGAAVAMTVAKGVVAYVASAVLRVPVAVSLESAFLLAGAGEFAFVLLSLARGGDVLSAEIHQTAVTVAALSMLTIPLLGGAGRKVALWLSSREYSQRHGLDTGAAELADHVIIGGFGRVGQTIAGILESEGIAYVALDLDGDAVAANRLAGRSVYYGDASRREFLDRAGGAGARSFVVTTNNKLAAERMVSTIHNAWPSAPIHARAVDGPHARRLVAAGATDVIPEALEASLALAGRVLGAVGLPEDAIDSILTARRDAE